MVDEDFDVLDGEAVEVVLGSSSSGKRSPG